MQAKDGCGNAQNPERGAARMEEFERKLADDVEARVKAAGSGEHTTTTGSRSTITKRVSADSQSTTILPDSTGVSSGSSVSAQKKIKLSTTTPLPQHRKRGAPAPTQLRLQTQQSTARPTRQTQQDAPHPRPR